MDPPQIGHASKKPALTSPTSKPLAARPARGGDPPSVCSAGEPQGPPGTRAGKRRLGCEGLDRWRPARARLIRPRGLAPLRDGQQSPSPPNSDEWELAQAELDDLVASLKAEGHGAWLREPRDGNYSAGGIVTDPRSNVSVFLWENVPREVVGAVVTLALRELAPGGSSGQRKAKGVIYGPNGDVLRTFDLPADESDGSS